MKANGITYRNLRAEMSRQGIGIGDIAARLSYNRDTLSRKLSCKSAITLKEAFEIQKTYFPGMDLMYLFEL